MASSYSRHLGTQHAAAIAYRVLFSLVPFLALVVSLADLLLPESPRERFLEWLFSEFPGTEAAESVDRALAESTSASPVVGLVSLGLLLWGASGMMASLRHAFTAIWDVERPKGYVRGKLRDVALVALAGAFLIAAFALSVVAQLLAETGMDVADAFGWEGAGGALSTLGELASSLLAVTGALLVVYRFVPPTRVPLTHVWPSALAVAVAFQLGVAGFAVYAARIADFNTAYGPLGTVFAFLLLVYLLAVVLLVGGQRVAAQALRRGKADGPSLV